MPAQAEGGVKALSLTQPWAWLVVHGPKRIENRKWHLPRSMRGETFLVHAAKGVTKADCEGAREVCEAVLDDPAYPRFELPPMGDLVRGAIIGRARVTDCWCPLATLPAEEQERAASRDVWWFTDQHGFVLVDVVAFAEPIPCKGALGFWTVPDDIARRLP